MAKYNADEIKRLAILLAGNVKFKSEYSAIANGSSKVLLVEGGTDERFADHIKTDTLVYVNADRVFNSNSSLRTKAPEYVNTKESIVQVIFGISRFPSPFIAYPDDIDKWDLYGLVDLDCDELSSRMQVPRLFVTDTHDLETLLMSTDRDIFNRIEGCCIPEPDVNRALFVAYQLSQVREWLQPYHSNKEFNLRTIRCGANEVDFYDFLNNDRINLHLLADYVRSHSSDPLSTQKLSSLCEKLLKEKDVKKKVSAEGIWKQDLSAFDPHKIVDFWTHVNGHDILALIRYYNANAHLAFQNRTLSKLNRNFELALIETYDYSVLTSTRLYTEMKAAGVAR